jgi:intracellular multiplication protein IcmP
MPGGQGNRSAWPSNDDFTFLSLAVVVIGLGFFGWLGWTNYHAEVSGVVAHLARWEICLVSIFTPALNGLDQTVENANLNAVTVPEILGVLNRIGLYLRVPVIVFILILAGFCFTRAAPSQFTRALDLNGLIEELTPTFGSIAAFAKRNLRLVPLQPAASRPSDPALHALEWVQRFARSNGKSGPADGIALDEVRATQAFTDQLGPMWRGVERAPEHVRILYAAFALHLEQRREEARDLLTAFSTALPPGDQADTTGPTQFYAVPAEVVGDADKALRAKDMLVQAGRIAAGHAYTTPVLMSLLTAARRRSGVLAPAQFACLKLVDRNLWYALHSLGFEGDGPGQTTHPNPRVEAAGARDHWAAERTAGRSLVIPSVSRAVSAVRAAIGQDEVTIKLPEAV